MGRIEPISLLAYMMVTRQVSSRMASATCWGVMVPVGPTSSSVTSKPSFSSFFSVCSTAWCSKAVEMMCFLPFRSPIRAAETMAWLSASLPPEVNVISLKLHPRQSATRRRASASASAACWPTVCRLEGLPYMP